MKRLIHVSVVKDSKDILARTIDASAKQKIGEAKQVVFQIQTVLIVLKTKIVKMTYLAAGCNVSSFIGPLVLCFTTSVIQYINNDAVL